MPVSGSKTIRIHEYEEVPYSALPSGGAARLERVVSRLRAPVFRFYRNHARARQYVGVVSTGREVIEILPKVHERADDNLSYLISLLGYTRRISLKTSGTSGFESLRHSFLEILVRHFALDLRRLLKNHHRMRYRETEDHSRFLRGKLLTERDLDGSGRLYGCYPCRYEEFTPDNPLNRILKFCNRLLLRQTRVPSTRKILRENDALLSEVSDVMANLRMLDGLYLNRIDTGYARILALCRLLLTSGTLDMKSGSTEQLAFVFDMNLLFEEFVERFIATNEVDIKVAGSPLVSTERQKRIGKLYGEFEMRADLILENAAGRRILIDTKYKRLNAAKRHLNLSQSDFYQMHAYGTAGDREYDDIVLLYPATTPGPRIFLTRSQGSKTLHVTQLDIRGIFDDESGRPDRSFVLKELNEAFTIPTLTDP